MRVGIPCWRSRNAFPECLTERGILGLPRVPVPRSAFRRNSPCSALTEHPGPGAGLRRLGSWFEVFSPHGVLATPRKRAGVRAQAVAHSGPSSDRMETLPGLTQSRHLP
jgi:hypothetical protein